ncbi:MAG: preprotein translocase subunit SecG [Candidatus Omnitrophica bacterium]|nr:preprotein translocase subunit SecG [Candidatus Omnitrophota bacterium]
MYIFLIVVHVIACLILIATILLQAGRGGGLTEAFTGDATQSVLGTQAPVVLKKATTVSAVLFLVTSLSLGITTARQGRSLFEKNMLPAVPVLPVQTEVPVTAGKAREADSLDSKTVASVPVQSREAIPAQVETPVPADK